jgi:hypothetical protein
MTRRCSVKTNIILILAGDLGVSVGLPDYPIFKRKK